MIPIGMAYTAAFLASTQARVLLHLAHEVLQRLELPEVAPPAMVATVALFADRVLYAIFREVALRPLQPHKLSEVAVSFVRSLPANRTRCCWHF